MTAENLWMRIQYFGGEASVRGINASAAIAEIADTRVANDRAALEEYATNHPPMAEPSGRPDRLRPIETVRTRPTKLSAPLAEGEQGDIDRASK
jgi:hypothetical protein